MFSQLPPHAAPKGLAVDLCGSSAGTAAGPAATGSAAAAAAVSASQCPRGKYGLPSKMMALITSGCG